MFCQNCGSEIANGKKFCENCGQPVPESQQQAAPVAQAAAVNVSTIEPQQPAPAKAEYDPFGDVDFGNSDVPTYTEVKEPSSGGKSTAIAAFVLGLVGWLTSLFIIPGFVMGPISIVMATKAKRNGASGGMVVAAYIFAILALIGALFMTLLTVYAYMTE